MYLILLCAFASGIIFIIGTEKITESIDFKPLNSSAPTPLQLYSGSAVNSRRFNGSILQGTVTFDVDLAD